MHTIPIKASEVARLKKGYPWVYKHAIQGSKLPPVTPGECVYFVDEKKRPFAIGYYNPLTKLAGRILTLDHKTPINEDFFLNLFKKALAARERRFEAPFYRLVHAEGDGLPGLIIDRFGDTLVCQTNTAGMEQLKPFWLAALQTLLSPSRVICRDDTPLREKEGLPLTITAPLGALDAHVAIEQQGITFFADPTQGQKTGWFYDQRSNRHWLSLQAAGKTVLDLYTYSGGFGIAAASQGATRVTLVDGSASALALATLAAKANKLESLCTFVKANVFDLLPTLINEGQSFDIVIADPPAFVKQALQKGQGLRGYQKLAKLASQVVAPGGLFFMASCSHHASMTDFRQAVESGIAKAGRTATFIRKAGADKDHPMHPLIPENYYLKALAYTLE